MPCNYSKYPPNWFTEIRPRVLQRAGNCCEWPGCGLANNSTACSVKQKNRPTVWYKTPPPMYGKRGVVKKWVRVVLTIAHLDNDPENHSIKDERLQALCQLHHLQLDVKHKNAQRIKKLGDMLIK